jgi:hypothetical protein
MWSSRNEGNDEGCSVIKNQLRLGVGHNRIEAAFSDGGMVHGFDGLFTDNFGSIRHDPSSSVKSVYHQPLFLRVSVRHTILRADGFFSAVNALLNSVIVYSFDTVERILPTLSAKSPALYSANFPMGPDHLRILRRQFDTSSLFLLPSLFHPDLPRQQLLHQPLLLTLERS